MTMLLNRDDKGPGTHALVIGVGGYPGFAKEEPGLLPAYQSGLLVGNWLATMFRNPGAPLASLDLLVSAPGGYRPPIDRGEYERPTFQAVQTAVATWMARCQSHEDNIALFFFSGYGAYDGGGSLLCLDDFPGPGMPGGTQVPSFASIPAAMFRCKARRQVYFIDTARIQGEEGVTGQQLLGSTPARSPPPRRTIIYSTPPADTAFARRDSPSFFAEALVDALMRARVSADTGAVMTSGLGSAIEDYLAMRLRTVGLAPQLVKAESLGSFELHFPDSGARGDIVFPTASPAEAGTGHAHDRPRDRKPAKARAKAAEGRRDAPARKRADLKAQDIATGPAVVTQAELGGGAPNEGGASPARGPADGGELPLPSEGGEVGSMRRGRGGFLGRVQHWLRADVVIPEHGSGVDDLPIDGPPGAGGSAPDLSPATDPDVAASSTAGELPVLDEGSLDGGPAPFSRDESNTEFIPDDAETERDELGRSVLAIGLARRLHRIWRTANETPPAPAGGEDERAAFVVHLDAPWGGGKTTFANYLARVLNPLPDGRAPAAFLRERYGKADLGGIFLDDPPADDEATALMAELPAAARRPWIVVPFNAWQAEHCAPPWWVFYQAIRKHCFRAIRREGDLAWRPRPTRSWPARLGDRLLRRARGLDRWTALVAREYGWRAGNPKILSLLATAAIGGVMLLLLYWLGAWGVVEAKGATTAGFILTSGLGLFAAGLTGVTGLWALGALLTESIVPGTNSLAERLSLGTGDPFERFRRHFYRTMADVRRPVMVVVDDLDRCRPDFVVDLIRGMQTLLRSPRVVFVILGDRDWIERAFEAHHKAMEKVDVGPEQSLGARFVEKAIQMSFILPAMGNEGRLAYVRRVLLGAPDTGARESRPALDVDTARAVREVANREAAAPDSDPFNTQRIVDRALEEIAARPDSSAEDVTAHKHQVEQLVGETLAINATSSQRVEQAVAHQLEALAAHFPANPRQIKRIVNAITIYYAVALQRPGLNPTEAFRTQLALWVIIMTEWPDTWRLIASFPALVRIVRADDWQKALAAETGSLPGSPEATAGVVRHIVADSGLMALIRGEPGDPLDPDGIPLLAQLTPLHSRRRRLPDASPTAGPPPAAKRKRRPAPAAPRQRRTPPSRA